MNKKTVFSLLLILLVTILVYEHVSKSKKQFAIGGERFTPRYPSILQRFLRVCS